MAVSLTDKIKFIQSVLGKGKLSSTGRNLDVYCPVCAPADKSKKKLSIRLEDDANHCWTCDWKARTLVSLVKKFGSREQLVEYRDKFLPDDKKKHVTFDDIEVKPLTLPPGFVLLPLAPSFDPDVKAAWRYVTGRGLNLRDVWYFKLGVSDDFRWRRRVIVPSFDAQGSLNYFVGRAIDAQKKPKYDNPDKDKLSIIFNEMNVDWENRLVLCEGSFDMFKCGDNVVPLLGSSLNEQSTLFNSIIAHGTPIDLALDADMLETRALSIAEKLIEYDIDVRIVDVRPFADPGKMTKEQFAQKREESKEFSWTDTFSTRLRRASKTTLAL